MKIITLNAQGLTEFTKLKRILTKLKPLSPDIILFQEIFDYNITPERQKLRSKHGPPYGKEPYMPLPLSPPS